MGASARMRTDRALEAWQQAGAFPRMAKECSSVSSTL